MEIFSLTKMKLQKKQQHKCSVCQKNINHWNKSGLCSYHYRRDYEKSPHGRAKKEEWKKNNPKKIRAYQQKYYNKNKRKFHEHWVEYYENNKDKLKKYSRTYYQKHKREILKKQKIRYKKRIARDVTPKE